MLLAICMMLPMLQLAQTDNVQDNKLLQSFICDDDQIKDMAQELKLVKFMNENMQLKFNAFNMSINKQLGELKIAVASIDDHKKSGAAATVSYASGFSGVLPNFCQSGRSGIQAIHIPKAKLSPFLVNYIEDPEQAEDHWIIIQRRRDGSVDFNREYNEYKQGFGNLMGEFFIGLDNLHALTQSALYELWIQMEDFSNETRWARYSTFAIADENELYALTMLGGFRGNGGDSLTYHVGKPFATRDRDFDKKNEDNCEDLYLGAWWYENCFESNLNGKYSHTGSKKNGIIWKTFGGYGHILKYVHMAIRPVKLI